MDTETELELSLDVAEYVTTTLANYNSPYGCYYSYEESCTVSSYKSVLSTLKNSYDEAIVFSKGHRGVPYLSSSPPNSDHRSLLDHYGNNLIDYADIYSRTSSDNIVTFIWHCETSEEYPSTYNYSYGWCGMPYCWTHDNGMDEYDDTGSQVFLGWTNEVPGGDYPWEGGSPQYEFEIVPDTYNYANVAGCFWYYMCNGYTVEEALDTLSLIIYGEHFDDTDLKDWLLVWGNWELELP